MKQKLQAKNYTGTNTQCCTLSVFDEAKVMSTFNEAARAETNEEQIICTNYGERRGLIGSCRQSCNPNEAEATGEELCTGTNTQCCILSVFDEAKVMSTFNEAARAEGTCASYGERRGLIGSCRQSCNPNEAEATGEELCTGTNTQCCTLSVFDEAKVMSTFAKATKTENELIETVSGGVVMHHLPQE